MVSSKRQWRIYEIRKGSPRDRQPSFMRFNESLYRLGSLDPWIWMTGNSKHQSKLAYMTPCLKNREAFASETHHAFTCEHIRDDRHSFSWYYSCYQPHLDSNLSGSLRGRLRTVGVVTARSQSTEYCHNGRSKEQCPFPQFSPLYLQIREHIDMCSRMLGSKRVRLTIRTTQTRLQLAKLCIDPSGSNPETEAKHQAQ